MRHAEPAAFERYSIDVRGIRKI
ncbi:hypothetical protein LK455_27605 [Nocardia abscessus]|nr:hypothetical protein [Nocardia abscessus]